MNVTIGSYGVPAILAVVLGIIYNLSPKIRDKWKAPISLLAGIGLGMCAMVYNLDQCTTKAIIDYGLEGLMSGAAAVGLYEGIYRPAKKPRG